MLMNFWKKVFSDTDDFFESKFGQIFHCAMRIHTFSSDKHHALNAWIWVACGHVRENFLYFVVSGLISYIYCVSFRWFWDQNYPLFPKNMCESYGKIFISKWPSVTMVVEVVHNDNYSHSDVRKIRLMKTMKWCVCVIVSLACFRLTFTTKFISESRGKVRWPAKPLMDL
jgi:hypothetical protein